MARFFFVLHECGMVYDDEEGRELPDLASAHAKAIYEARAIMSHEVGHGRLCLSCWIAIKDVDHQEVARVPFREALNVDG